MGATTIRSSADILEALGLEKSETKAGATNSTKSSTRRDDMNDDKQRILDAISIEPISRDELAEILNIDSVSLSILLSELEIKNLIKIDGSMVSM